MKNIFIYRKTAMAQKTTQYEIKFFTGRLLIKMDQHKCNKISICTNLSNDDGAQEKKLR